MLAKFLFKISGNLWHASVLGLLSRGVICGHGGLRITVHYQEIIAQDAVDVRARAERAAFTAALVRAVLAIPGG